MHHGRHCLLRFCFGSLRIDRRHRGCYGLLSLGGATALTEIHLAGTTLPTVGNQAFAWDIIANKSCTVYVKDEATKEACNTAEWSYWKEFYNADKVVVQSDTATAITNAVVAPKATKVIRNDQVLILRDGKTFNLTGQEVK